MNQNRSYHLLRLTLLLLSGCVSHAYALSPVGDWQVTNMVTNKKQAIVRIWQTQPNEWSAKIIKSYSPDKRLQSDKIMMRMIKQFNIVKTFPANNQQWDGEYLNPYTLQANDKSSPPETHVERCRLLLSRNHKQLLVRTYQHLPLLGHLEVWTRIKK